MSMAKDTACSSCHGELGPDIHGCIMCYGCGPEELLPPERRHLAAPERGPQAIPAGAGVARPAAPQPRH